MSGESQNNEYQIHSVFEDLQDSKQKSVGFIYGQQFSHLMTSQLQNLKIKCCCSEYDVDIENALAGIMRNDQKFSAMHSAEKN